MSRPTVYGERKTTAIRLPVELHQRLVEAAAEREVAVNRLVIVAIEDMLERLIPVDELRLTR